MSDSPDIAVLRTASGGGALPLLRVFVSGFASRHDLPVDRLDDIQLAVETLLAEEPEGEDDVVLEMSAVGGGLRLRLDGLRNQSVRAALLATDAFRPCEGCLLDVRVLLDSLVDGYRVVDVTAGSFLVEMNKRTS
jgi:hypothetical protein